MNEGQPAFENEAENSHDGVKEKSPITEKRKEAFKKISEQLIERCDSIFETLCKDPTCERGGRAYEINSKEEMLVATAQRVKGELLASLESVNEKGEYSEIEVSADLLGWAERYLETVEHEAYLLEKYGENEVKNVLGKVSPGISIKLEKAGEDFQQLEEEVV